MQSGSKIKLPAKPSLITVMSPIVTLQFAANTPFWVTLQVAEAEPSSVVNIKSASLGSSEKFSCVAVIVTVDVPNPDLFKLSHSGAPVIVHVAFCGALTVIVVVLLAAPSNSTDGETLICKEVFVSSSLSLSLLPQEVNTHPINVNKAINESLKFFMFMKIKKMRRITFVRLYVERTSFKVEKYNPFCHVHG